MCNLILATRLKSTIVYKVVSKRKIYGQDYLVTPFACLILEEGLVSKMRWTNEYWLIRNDKNSSKISDTPLSCGYSGNTAYYGKVSGFKDLNQAENLLMDLPEHTYGSCIIVKLKISQNIWEGEGRGISGHVDDECKIYAGEVIDSIEELEGFTNKNSK